MTPSAGGPSADDGGSARQVDSPWWYVLVLGPMVGSLVAVVAAAVATVAVVAARADLSTYAPAYFALAFMGIPLTVLYPLAIHRDASAVAASDVGWTPDPSRYALAAALAAATGFLLAVPLSWRYLRRRRSRVGRP